MSAERIKINEDNQSQGRVVLADVFNVLIVNDEVFTEADTTLYEDSAEFQEKYEDSATSSVIYAAKDLISAGLGVYVSCSSQVEKYKDKYQYDISFIMDWRNPNNIDQSSDKIDSLIESRADVLYLPADYTSITDNDPDKISQANANKFATANSSYKAQYTPSLEIYKTESGKKSKKTYPGSYAFLRNFAQSVGNGNPAWYAIAGVNRGLVNYVDSISRAITDDEFNSCQDMSSSTNSNYNPIMYLNNTYGNVIYGQRTLDKDNSALKSVNVRILSNMIKKRIFNICLGLLFEVNDLTLWNEFRGQLDPYLAAMRYNRGLVNYEIVMDQTSQKSAPNELTVKGYVRIQPTRAAEYFYIDFVLTNSGAEVNTEGEE